LKWYERLSPGRQILFIKALCEPGFEEPDYKGENRQFDEEANLTTQDSDSTDSDSTDSDSTITNTTPKQTIPNPNFNNTITHHAGGMPVCFDQRPELDFDYLVRIVSDVNVQIEMACKTPGMFDEDYFPVTVSAYALDNCPHADAERDLLERTGTHEGLVGIDRVNAVLYGPLKNLEALLANFLSQVDNWGARAR